MLLIVTTCLITINKLFLGCLLTINKLFLGCLLTINKLFLGCLLTKIISAGMFVRVISIFALLASSIFLSAEMKSPDEFMKSSEPEEEVYTGALIPFYSMIRLYQIFISPVKQENCRMYPSCSHYGIYAIKKFGLSGILMTADRLHRCGHDLEYYNRIITHGKIYYYDLPE